MKINEFCQALQERVEDFQKYWKKCQKDYPHFYPDELEDAVWFEQFLTFLELEKEAPRQDDASSTPAP